MTLPIWSSVEWLVSLRLSLLDLSHNEAEALNLGENGKKKKKVVSHHIRRTKSSTHLVTYNASPECLHASSHAKHHGGT